MAARRVGCLAGAIVAIAGCAVSAPPAATDEAFAKMMSASFRDAGIARRDRLLQDDANAACSAAAGTALPPERERAIRAEARATVRFPADGRFLGDWRLGEKLARNSHGMTWSDPSPAPAANGGGCINCHEITKAEIAHGTLGPSLYRYGRRRGVADPDSAAARPIVESTWIQLWNPRAASACSGMPRFGHAGLLDEAQLKHLMALLLDPGSPVNN